MPKTYDPSKEKKKLVLMAYLFVLVVIWSAIKPYNYLSWSLMVIPASIYGLTLAFTIKKFQFTTFAYFMVFLHIVILLIGSKYTYTLNPLFEFIKDIFNSNRNNFDRVGHLAQGFIPIILVKEFYLRQGYMVRSKFFYVTIFAFVLAISASYELLEFLAGIISGKPDYILSPQGDNLDTQWDMVMALVGAALSLLIFRKYHDRKIIEIEAYKDSIKENE